MKTKKIFILVGHPDTASSSHEFAESYKKGAESKGHEVKLTSIADLKFDPILHKGYKAIQELEPDLVQVQQDIRWCEHLVIIYPVWWSSMPALFKGMIERMWLPGFAYRFKGLYWEKLLKGRSARIIITMDNWPLVARILFGDITNEVSRGLCWFSGIHPVRVTKIGLMKFMKPAKKEAWRQKLVRYGQKAR